ncbi:MAG: glycerophosphodiester phosphodiesterase [Actinomycetota bacterium]
MPTRPLVLAHRGACRRAPENTLEAFAVARDLGADGVELDVRVSADGVLVVHHDASVPGVGLLAALPFAAIREAAPQLATLAEALDECEGMIVNVEVKCLPWEADADPEHRVAAAAADLVRAGGAKVVFSSFDLGAVDAVRTHAPDTTTAFLVAGQELAPVAEIARTRGHNWLHPDRDSVLCAPAPAVTIAHGAGLSLTVWTVDDPAEIRVLADAGVDGLITNVPDVALAVLG